jgi:hypothetical protein
MTTRTLNKSDWQSYFDRMGGALEGKRASVEITSPTLGDQWAAKRLPLFGISYDPRDDLIEVAMEGVEHLVHHPQAVTVEEQGAGLASLEIVAEDGAREIVMFHDPLMLRGDASGARSDHTLILGSRVMGTPVFNKAGERIGHIDDLSINRISGQVTYAIMSFGGFLGIGERFHPLPWSILDYDPQQGGYVVPLDKAALEAAPSYDRHELAELGGPSHQSYGEQIFGYYGPYGSVPYW